MNAQVRRSVRVAVSVGVLLSLIGSAGPDRLAVAHGTQAGPALDLDRALRAGDLDKARQFVPVDWTAAEQLFVSYLERAFITPDATRSEPDARTLANRLADVFFKIVEYDFARQVVSTLDRADPARRPRLIGVVRDLFSALEGRRGLPQFPLYHSRSFNEDGLVIFKRLLDIADRFRALSFPRGELFALYCMADIRRSIPRAAAVADELGDDLSLLLARSQSVTSEPVSEASVRLAERLGLPQAQVFFLWGLAGGGLRLNDPRRLEQSVRYLEEAREVARGIPVLESVNYAWFTASTPLFAEMVLRDLWVAYQKLQRPGEAAQVLADALEMSRPFGEGALKATLSAFANRAAGLSWDLALPVLQAGQAIGPKAEFAVTRSLAGSGPSFKVDVAEKALALAVAIPDSQERAAALYWYSRSRRVPTRAAQPTPPQGTPPAGPPRSPDPDAFPPVYERLFEVCVEAGELVAAAEALAWTADRQGAGGNRTLAMETFNRAIRLAEQAGDQLKVAQLANRANGRTGRWPPAIQADLATRAAAAAEAADSPLELSKALVLRAQAATAGTGQTLEDLIRAAAAAGRYTERTGQPAQESDCLRLLARERVRRGEYLAAIDVHRQWAEVAGRYGPVDLEPGAREAEAYEAMADVYATNLGEPTLAFEAANHARRAMEGALNWPSNALADTRPWSIYVSLGRTAATLGRPAEALEYWAKGLDKAAGIGSADSGTPQLLRRVILTDRAALFARLGDYEASLRDWEEVRALTPLTLKNYRMPEAVQKAQSLAGLAWTLALAGDLDKALATAREAVAEFTRDDPAVLSIPTGMPASVEVQFVPPDPEEAIATVIGSVADVLTLTGHAEEAVAFCSLESIRRALADRPLAKRIHLERSGRAYVSAGRPDQGRAFLLSAVEVDRNHATAGVGGLSGDLLALGDLEASAGNDAKAKDYLVAARAAANAYDVEQVWRIERSLARVLVRLGDSEAAETHYEGALKALESARERLRRDEFRLRHGESRDRIYEEYAALLAARALSSAEPADAARAFLAAERKRAQILSGLLAEGWSRVPPDAVPDQLRRALDTEARVSAKRVLLNEQLLLPAGKGDAVIIESLKRDLDRLQADLAGLLVSVAQGRYRYAAPTSLAAVPAASVRAALGPSRALVEYLVTDDRSYAFVVSQARVSVIPLAVARAGMREQVRRLLAPFGQLRTGAVDAVRVTFDAAAAHDLYQAVFAPVRSALGSESDILIVPDDVLNVVPFEALLEQLPQGAARSNVMHAPLADAAFLLRRYTISYLDSSAQLLTGTGAGGTPQTSRRLFAMANPAGRPPLPSPVVDDDPLKRQLRSGSFGAYFAPLPGADEEVRRISVYFPPGASAVVSGRSATEAAYRSRAGEAAILHFATHAVASDSQPFYSTLILAPDAMAGDDGFLQAYEVLRTPLRARLVVLSGCETALGAGDWGQGLVGLVAAFEHAGAQSVLATLWSIDESTADVMAAFYRAMAQGASAPAALRQAKLQMMQKRIRLGNVDVSLAHPFFWAPFKLVGTTSR